VRGCRVHRLIARRARRLGSRQTSHLVDVERKRCCKDSVHSSGSFCTKLENLALRTPPSWLAAGAPGRMPAARGPEMHHSSLCSGAYLKGHSRRERGRRTKCGDRVELLRGEKARKQWSIRTLICGTRNDPEKLQTVEPDRRSTARAHGGGRASPLPGGPPSSAPRGLPKREREKSATEKIVFPIARSLSIHHERHTETHIPSLIAFHNLTRSTARQRHHQRGQLRPHGSLTEPDVRVAPDLSAHVPA
jgi:hypothetical protein